MAKESERVGRGVAGPPGFDIYTQPGAGGGSARAATAAAVASGELHGCSGR